MDAASQRLFDLLQNAKSVDKYSTALWKSFICYAMQTA
jgi:hypothetical protein